MMKILMLGWEFPPYISGGLGVACKGLTSALIKTDEVQILFVIPRAPETSQDHLTIVGANTIEVPVPHLRKKTEAGKTTTVTSESHEHVLAKTKFSIKSIEASLNPYEQIDQEVSEQISYEFISKYSSAIAPTDFMLTKKSDNWEDGRVAKYNFDGGYGKKLLEEVDKYANIVASFAMEHEFDVIHAHDWMTFPAGVAIKHATGKPLLVHFHATEFDRAGTTGSNIVYDIERLGIRRANKVLSVSGHTREILIKRYGAAPDHVSVVYNGIDSNGDPKRAVNTHPLGDQLVSFVGRITFQKGPEYFVDAAEKVLKEFPNCHFVMAGAGDALPDMIKRVIAKRISSNFHFTGFLDPADVERLLKFTRVYVMPSVSEPFGLTALEAVNAGVPSVISVQSGVSEVLPDVLKVDFWDTDALAQAICGVLRYPLLAETMRQKGLNSVTSISWEAVAAKVLNIYREVLTRDVSPSPSIL